MTIYHKRLYSPNPSIKYILFYCSQLGLELGLILSLEDYPGGGSGSGNIAQFSGGLSLPTSWNSVVSSSEEADGIKDKLLHILNLYSIQHGKELFYHFSAGWIKFLGYTGAKLFHWPQRIRIWYVVKTQGFHCFGIYLQHSLKKFAGTKKMLWTQPKTLRGGVKIKILKRSGKIRN